MATEPCEITGENEDHPDPIKEREIPAEETQKQTNKEKQGDATVMANQQKMISTTPNGIEKEEGDTLHVVEKDLDEFVDSVTEVASSGLPEKSPEEAKQPVSEKAPMKSPRAEQIAEKVLRAEKVPEKAPRAEKFPGREKTPEPKAARAEKTPKPQEKTVRVEKPPEKARPAVPAAPKPVKRKTEARGKDTVPWEGLTLNKCLLVASFVALLSVGCQVFQEIIEYSENVLRTELEAWTSQEGGVGELDERWFYERWLDWSDDEEPLEMEDDEEEEEEEVLEMEGNEEEEEEEEPELIDIEEKEEEEETEEAPVSKGSPRKSREKAVRKEKVSRGQARKDREPVGKEEEEEEEEEKSSHGRRHRREGKAKSERQRQEEEGKSHHRKEGRREDCDRGKARPEPERDSRPRRLEPKITPRPFSSLSKEGAHKFGRHKVREAWRQD